MSCAWHKAGYFTSIPMALREPPKVTEGEPEGNPKPGDAGNLPSSLGVDLEPNTVGRDPKPMRKTCFIGQGRRKGGPGRGRVHPRVTKGKTGLKPVATLQAKSH